MKNVIAAALVAAYIIVPSASWALTEPELMAISERVFAIEDAPVRAAYLTLRQAKILEPDGKQVDVPQQLKFRVLEANNPDVAAAFKLLLARNVFGAQAPAPLSVAEAGALESVRQALIDCRREQAGLEAKRSRLTQFGWVRERAELPGLISAQLDTMGSAYVRAKDLFLPFAARQEPAIIALGADVKRAEAEMTAWYDWWNNYAQQ